MKDDRDQLNEGDTVLLIVEDDPLSADPLRSVTG